MVICGGLIGEEGLILQENDCLMINCGDMVGFHSTGNEIGI